MMRNFARPPLILLGMCLSLAAVSCRPTEPPSTSARSSTSEAADTPGGPWFTEVTADWQLDVVHSAAGRDRYFFPAIMTPGVALLDFDGDGDLDVLLSTGCDPSVVTGKSREQKPAEPESTPRLFRQDAGPRFVEVTHDVGLAVPLYCSGAAVGDVNNDGFPDIYITAYGGDRLFQNDSGKRFVDITREAGIDNARWSVSAAMLDYDRDGWLDIFVTNYVDYDPARPCLGANGSQDFCNPSMFPRTADKLYHNVSRPAQPPESKTTPESPPVRFADVSLSSGIGRKPGAGLGVVCADFNQDGWPDIYVANDGHANFLWLNQGNGTFQDEAVLWGCAADALGRGQGSMGIAVDDLNGDGRPDLLVTNLDGENNALYRSLPSDGFEEVSERVGLAAASFPMTGFGTAWLDVDRDGDLDLVVANGRVRRRAVATAGIQEPVAAPSGGFWDDYAEANHLYLQTDGRFAPARHRGDALVSGRAVSRGLAAGDLDNDGDVDLIITIDGGPVRVLRNDTPASGHWLSVRAVEPQYGGRDAYGARIELIAEPQRWTRWVNPGQSYLSSHDPRVFFGLGHVDQLTGIEVTWLDGTRERFPCEAVDRAVTLRRGTGVAP